MKRVTAAALRSFHRNGSLSAATVLMMSLTLFVVGGLLLLSVVANTILDDIEQKIDVSVSFRQDTDERDILSIKSELEAVRGVSDVTYVSRDEALAAFRERHRDDPTILASLEELGDENPLQASLTVRAHRSEDLGTVIGFLEEKNYPQISKRTDGPDQRAIERLSSILTGVRSLGIALVLVLAFVAVLVAFNTVRLAIFTAREEITIMRLVGATSWYIRGPFILEGILAGLIAAVITSLIYFPVVWLAAPRLRSIVPSINLTAYFAQNFFEFLAILIVAGALLGATSSTIAIRRYLRA